MDADRIATIMGWFRYKNDPITRELCDALLAAQAENTATQQANTELFEKCDGLWTKRDALQAENTRHVKHVNKIAAYLAINGYTWDELGETVVQILTDWKADYTSLAEHLLREEERGDRLASQVTDLTEMLQKVTDELSQWGMGDFHYGDTPQERRVVEPIEASRALLARFSPTEEPST